ncbi:MAG TPA: hypothetical protein V6C69_07395, partial [Trichormus sp.]
RACLANTSTTLALCTLLPWASKVGKSERYSTVRRPIGRRILLAALADQVDKRTQRARHNGSSIHRQGSIFNSGGGRQLNEIR